MVHDDPLLSLERIPSLQFNCVTSFEEIKDESLLNNQQIMYSVSKTGAGRFFRKSYSVLNKVSKEDPYYTREKEYGIALLCSLDSELLVYIKDIDIYHTSYPEDINAKYGMEARFTFHPNESVYGRTFEYLSKSLYHQEAEKAMSYKGHLHMVNINDLLMEE